MNLSEELAKLVELHANGHLTDDEFAAAKKRLLEPEQPEPALPQIAPLEVLPVPVSPWETAIVQSHDGMSDAYWKAKYRKSLSPVPIVLMIMSLGSCFGCASLSGEAARMGEEHSQVERIAYVVTGVLALAISVGLCIWSLNEPYRAGITAIIFVLVIGILNTTLFVVGDAPARPDGPAEPNPVALALTLGWIFRFVIILVLVWGVLDARNPGRYKRKRS